MEKIGIYIHIPFCERKCRYCDFPSFAGVSRDDRKRYFRALLAEVRECAGVLRGERAADTVFVGGGTPTALDAGALEELIGTVLEEFSVREGAEITTEANPGTVDAAYLSRLFRAGFGRISFGVQSFSDEVLSALGRIHTSAQARDAVLAARAAGFENVNVDLMLGVPRQTLSVWERDLAEAVSLGPAHVSFYSLQLEEGTPLYEDYRNGLAELPAWDDNRAMYAAARDFLAENGYGRYEISNAAREGFRCRHNMKYWTMADYLGLGSSAHSFFGGRRFSNPREPDEYVRGGGAARALEASLRDPVCGPSPEGRFARASEDALKELMGDFIFTELRLTEGFAPSDFSGTFGRPFSDVFGRAADALAAEGLLFISEDRIKLTEKGIGMTNPVMERLLTCPDT